jgi:hypothetical protein
MPLAPLRDGCGLRVPAVKATADARRQRLTSAERGDAIGAAWGGAGGAAAPLGATEQRAKTARRPGLDGLRSGMQITPPSRTPRALGWGWGPRRAGPGRKRGGLSGIDCPPIARGNGSGAESDDLASGEGAIR